MKLQYFIAHHVGHTPDATGPEVTSSLSIRRKTATDVWRHLSSGEVTAKEYAEPRKIEIIYADGFDLVCQMANGNNAEAADLEALRTEVRLAAEAAKNPVVNPQPEVTIDLAGAQITQNTAPVAPRPRTPRVRSRGGSPEAPLFADYPTDITQWTAEQHHKFKMWYEELPEDETVYHFNPGAVPEQFAKLKADAAAQEQTITQHSDTETLSVERVTEVPVEDVTVDLTAPPPMSRPRTRTRA